MLRSCEARWRLEEIPGVGPVVATALDACKTYAAMIAVGDGKASSYLDPGFDKLSNRQLESIGCIRVQAGTLYMLVGNGLEKFHEDQPLMLVYPENLMLMYVKRSIL